MKGYVEIVKLLLADPRVNPLAKNNYSIIMSAQGKYKNVVELLFGLDSVRTKLKDKEINLCQKLLKEMVVLKVKDF